MSAVTRQKKAVKAAEQARRSDALNRLTGRGGTDDQLVEDARILVNKAWRTLLDVNPSAVSGIIADRDDPYVPSRDGGRKKLRPTWEHLRAVLPDYNERKAWGRRSRAMHALLILAEKLLRKAARRDRCWVLHQHDFNETTSGVAEALRGE